MHYPMKTSFHHWSHSVIARNMGGRPKGTTNAFYWWLSAQRKKVVNFVVVGYYAEAKDTALAIR